MKARVFVFADLDDTLIQTAGKIPPGVKFEVGALARDGSPLSYVTSQQKKLLGLFSMSGAVVVPVTGRDCEALERVTLSFDSYSAVSHGAVVLKPDRTPCGDWQASLQQDDHDWPELLDDINRRVAEAIVTQRLDARTRVVVDHGIHTYVSVKGDKRALDALLPLFSSTPLRLHRNGHNLALLPGYACKKRAVEHICRLLGVGSDDLVMGMGDSLTDLPFMLGCHFGVVPASSQISRKCFNE